MFPLKAGFNPRYEASTRETRQSCGDQPGERLTRLIYQVERKYVETPMIKNGCRGFGGGIDENQVFAVKTLKRDRQRLVQSVASRV